MNARVSLLLLFFALSFTPVEAQKFKDFIKKTSKSLFADDGDIGLGLKQALEFGVNQAVEQLSAEDGYFDSQYKVLIPEEAHKVISKLKHIPGFENVERDLVAKMNQAAEYAAREATPIFVSAITGMTFDDALQILSGENDAATRYLERTTRDQLYESFMPVIQDALDEVNAREFWATAVSTYNQIPFIKRVNPELDDHVNNIALNGLFGEIEKKEAGIRTNQDERTTELLRNVFGKQDN